MAENMDFTISTENLDSDENLDLNDDFEIGCVFSGILVEFSWLKVDTVFY
jgi:hypothetical protein